MAGCVPLSSTGSQHSPSLHKGSQTAVELPSRKSHFSAEQIAKSPLICYRRQNSPPDFQHNIDYMTSFCWERSYSPFRDYKFFFFSTALVYTHICAAKHDFEMSQVAHKEEKNTEGPFINLPAKQALCIFVVKACFSSISFPKYT